MGKFRQAVSRVVWIALVPVVLLIAVSETGANPSFTIGSNHYHTVFAYPHDLLKWPDQAVVLYLNPQTLPWQGDVTDISNRPNDSYTTNHQSIEFAPPYGYYGNPNDVRSWMEVSGKAHKNRRSVGYLQNTNFGKFLVQLGWTSTEMKLTADGVGRATETVADVTSYPLVPFSGLTKASRDDFDLEVTYARHLFNMPVGAKVRYIRKSSGVPEGYINFVREGQEISTPHLTWGWATSGCNHIFGYSSINTDAFFQNSFSVLSGSQLDLQASFEHGPNHKSGIRYRTINEDGDNYRWRYDEGSEFHGDYYVDEQWKDRTNNNLIRGYDKVTFMRFGDLDLGMLFFLQRSGRTKSEVNRLVESESNSKESEREYIIETNPFANYVTKKGYFDFGLLIELSRTGMKNTRTRWNSVSRSDQTDVLWSTSPYVGWSPTWENFSSGRNWFFATGFEANSSVNVYKRLSIQTRLLVLRKYTWIQKIYGSSEIPSGGNSYEFFESHRRNDAKTETWMTGGFGFTYGWGPIQSIVSLELPLAYLISQSSKLEDASEVLFDHHKKSLWQVQQPVAVRLLLVMALGGHPGHP